MTVLYSQVTCTTAATKILDASLANTDGYLTASELASHPRRKVYVKNTSATVVYIGDSAVTTASGYSLGNNESVYIELYPLDSLYGRTASSTTSVQILTSG